MHIIHVEGNFIKKKPHEMSFVFYIPSPEARRYKTHNLFHYTLYGMKIHLRFFMSQNSRYP